jgi:hypothetical protein
MYILEPLNIPIDNIQEEHPISTTMTSLSNAGQSDLDPQRPDALQRKE